MTCREKLAKENPDSISEEAVMVARINTGTLECPNIVGIIRDVINVTIAGIARFRNPILVKSDSKQMVGTIFNSGKRLIRLLTRP